MELVIFFLKIWSIVWSLINLSMLYLFFKTKPSNINLKIDLKTCAEWCLWITSFYAWSL